MSWGRFGLVLGVAVGLAACSSSPPPPKAAAVDYGSCMQELEARQAVVTPLKGWRDAKGCGIDDPVKVSRGGIAWNRPGTLSCPMAARFARFEQEIVQPLALRHFGLQVRTTNHMGTYDCRSRRSTAGRKSEHASGLAIDIGGFQLTDGTQVSVLRDWSGAGAKSAFLQEVAKAACGSFSIVLTPNSDYDHRDHLHLDIGPYKLCGY